MNKQKSRDKRAMAIGRAIEKCFNRAFMKMNGERIIELMNMLDPLCFDELKFVSELSRSAVKGVELLCEIERENGGEGDPDLVWEYGLEGFRNFYPQDEDTDQDYENEDQSRCDEAKELPPGKYIVPDGSNYVFDGHDRKETMIIVH